MAGAFDSYYLASGHSSKHRKLAAQLTSEKRTRATDEPNDGPGYEYGASKGPAQRTRKHHALNTLLREKAKTKDRMSQFLDDKLRSQLLQTTKKKATLVVDEGPLHSQRGGRRDDESLPMRREKVKGTAKTS